jgi:hypothetical protein
MKEFFARLNPTERRFVVGVAVVFFLVINVVWVWPHFGDWSATRTRMDTASGNLAKFQGGANLIPGLRKEIEKYQKQGQVVPQADQAVQFVRLIQNEETKVGVMHQSMSPVRQGSGGATNAYFMEQGENLVLECSEKQLVDFLYNLGSGASLIRVKALSVSPDPTHQKLSTRVTLVASYQKKPVGPAPAASTPAATTAAPKAAQGAQPPMSKVTTNNGPKPAGVTNMPRVGPRSIGATNTSPNILRIPGATNRTLPGLPPPARNLTPTNK